MRTRWLSVALIAVLLTGAVYSHFLTGLINDRDSLVCAATGVMDCAANMQSAYGKIHGIPVSAVALAVFVFLLANAAWDWLRTRLSSRAEPAQNLFAMPLLCAYAASGAVVYFFCISAFILHSFCPYCIAMYALVAIWLAVAYGGLNVPLTKQPAFFVTYFRCGRRACAPGILAGVTALAALLLGTHPAAAPHSTLLARTESQPLPQEPLTITEFSDFECPACRRAAAELDSLLAAHPGKVVVKFVNFPLCHDCNPAISATVHPHACLAAKIGIVMQQHGKFEAYRRAVFADSGPLNPERLDQITAALGEQPLAIREEAENVRITDTLQNDIAFAQRTGVVATPSFIINGNLLKGGTALAEIRGLLNGDSASSFALAQLGSFNSVAAREVSAAATVTATPIPLNFFGMHIGVHINLSNPVLAPVQVGAMGKPVVTDWMYLERSRGVYTWDALDNAVLYAKNHNLTIFHSHADVPLWATSDTSTCFAAAIPGIYKCPAPPTDENTITACQGPLAGQSTTDCMWKEFLTSLVNRYKSTGIQDGCTAANPQCHGVIQMYEGWNEPPWPNPMPIADFVKFETDFLNTVRAIDPNAKVGSPAFIIDPAHPSYVQFMDDFFANGGPRTFDSYDFHIDATNPEDQLPRVAQFKQILTKYGLQNNTIYATESGRWGDCPVTVSDAAQQAYIGRIEPLYWSLGIQRHYWYAYDTCGTLTNQPTTTTLKPSGIAYGNLENWMIGATMSQLCAAVPDGSGTWTCGFTRPGGYEALEVWNANGSATYAPAAKYVRYRDLNGTLTPITGSVNIGQSPILLETGAPNAPVITSATTASGRVGVNFSYTITATNSPVSFSASTLPAGLVLNSSTGVISGTPTSAGTTSVKLSATNANGTGSATLSITIAPAIVAPAITTQPASKTINVGQTATFAVTATGSAPLSYQWLKNGTAITGASSSSYTTPAATHADNGTLFSCVVRNSAGSATSSAAKLTVANRAPTVASAASATPNPALSGQNITFSATGNDADGDALSYTWDFGDGTTGAGSQTTHVYRIKGTYTATVTIADGFGGTVTSSLAVTIESSLAWRFNSGGSTAGSFAADGSFSGGRTYSTTHAITTTGVTNPAPQAVYQTERYGNFTYTLTNLNPGGIYTVRLHFAEIYWSSAGKRLFNVAINGQQVISNFDIYAAAGGNFKAIVREFNAVATSGQIVVAYTTLKDNAKSSGIELVPVEPGPLALVAATESAAELADDTGIASIDLGTYPARTPLAIPLDLPDDSAGPRKLRWTPAKGSKLPSGAHLSNGKLTGTIKQPGTYTFTLQLKTPDKGLLINSYSLTIKPE